MLKKVLGSATALIAMSAGASAFAPGVAVNSGQYTIGISGFVPVICRASVGASLVSTTGSNVDLGGLSEFCNSPNGYVVYADYSANFAAATVVVDGQKINLAKGGETAISKSNTAAIANHSIALDLSKVQNSGGSISFRIAAL